MTESDWNACSDPQAMLAYLRNSGAADRKLRLFACGCCRRIWDHFPDPSNRDLVAAVEDYPDATFAHPVIRRAAIASSAREEEFRDRPAYWAAKYLGRGFYRTSPGMSAAIVAAKAVSLADEAYRGEVEVALWSVYVNGEFVSPVSLPPPRPTAVDAEASAQADLLRCVFGNPFRPAQFDPAWRTETAVLLAREMYAPRDFSAMPVLADALEESGCADEAVLAHCRRPGPHVRGCHVVDLVLNKT